MSVPACVILFASLLPPSYKGWCQGTDMQFVTNFTRTRFQNNFFNRTTRKLRQATFSDKTAKLYFHIININTQGYITLSKYIIGIASIGLPRVNLLATKYVTKRL